MGDLTGDLSHLRSLAGLYELTDNPGRAATIRAAAEAQVEALKGGMNILNKLLEAERKRADAAEFHARTLNKLLGESEAREAAMRAALEEISQCGAQTIGILSAMAQAALASDAGSVET
jgi:ABC-type transporter Mla subunit MlaD